MPEEHPPISKAYIMAYDGLDRAYPIVARGKDPTVAGYDVPAQLSALPEQKVGGIATTSHVFIEVRPTSAEQRVLWIYRLLPGPWIPSRDYDPLLGPVQVRRRSVLSTGQASSLSATGSLSYESQDGSDAVLWEIERIWSNGTGSGSGNDSFPVFQRDPYDDDRGPISGTEQLVAIGAGKSSSLSSNGTTVTQTTYEPYNQFYEKEVIETWLAAGQVKDLSPYDDDRGTITASAQLVADTGQTSTLTESGGTITQISYQPFNKVQMRKLTEAWPATGEAKHLDPYEDDRGAIAGTVQLVADTTGAVVSSLTESGGTVTRITYTPFNKLQSRKLTETWATTGPILPRASYNDERGSMAITAQLIARTSPVQTSTLGANAGVYTKTTYEPYSAVQIRKIIETWTPPGPVLTTQSYSEEARGRLVDTTAQIGLNATLNPESGNGIISSVTQDLDAISEKRVTKQFHSAELPPDETWYFWDWVAIPTLIFDMTINDYCDGSSFFALTKTVEKSGGGAVYRKHRRTVSYANTAPTTTAGDSWETQDLDYDGKVLSVHFNNALNNALSFDADFNTSSGGSSCGWTEAFDFAATTPSADDFAGSYYAKSDLIEPYGTTGFKRTLTEFLA